MVKRAHLGIVTALVVVECIYVIWRQVSSLLDPTTATEAGAAHGLPNFAIIAVAALLLAGQLGSVVYRNDTCSGGVGLAFLGLALACGSCVAFFSVSPGHDDGDGWTIREEVELVLVVGSWLYIGVSMTWRAWQLDWEANFNKMAQGENGVGT